MASEIKVDTVSEKTSGSGVTIDGLLIKDGGISGDVSLIGTTPTFTIGDAGAEDAALVFDGNAQDFYIALDDSADDLVIGLGSAVGTTPMLSFTEGGAATFKNVGTGDDNPMVLTLQTSETDMAANDILGSIRFQAPDEGTGTDAILIAASIDAISEGDFSSSSNATKLSFKTGVSEAASEKMSLSSAGLLTIADDLVIKDGGTIGVSSDADAITIASNGAVTFSQTPVFPDGSIAVADLDIDGATDIGAAIVDADLFIVDDGAGGTNRKVTASRIKTYAGGASTLNDLTDVSMDITNFTDGILIQPNSDGSAPTTGTLSSANLNIGIGKDVFKALTSGDNNVAIGAVAADALTEGSDNTIIGYNAGSTITTSVQNTLIGSVAGNAISTGNGGNVFIGYYAGSSCTTGAYNIAIGYGALDVSTTDTNNIAIGKDALGSANFGGAEHNVAIGNLAGDAVNTGDNNTYVGYNAGTTTESSSNNTLIGKDCLSNLGNGGNNTAVGSTLAASGANIEFSITLGYDITAESNDFTFGKSSNVVHNDFDADAAWSRSSDVRKKRNIYSQELGLDFINDLRTVRFQWKPSNEFPKEWNDYSEENNMDTEVIMHGFLAQEVKEALDKHASDDDKKFSGWSEGPDGMQNTSREMFVIPLIKAVQELSTEVKELKAKLEDK
jgi:hypothetical protein